MRLFRTTPAVFLVAALALVTGCADPTSGASSRSADATPSTTAGSATPATGSAGSTSKGRTEVIRPAGIAALVEEHLGALDVRSYGTYGDESGAVDLAVGLGAPDRRDMFVVSVHSPGQAEGAFGAPRRCARDKKSTNDVRRLTCHRLTDGTTVTAYLSQGGFSDDNADGIVVAGTSHAPDGSVALAMYESYDALPAVSAADLDRLLSDRRLRWRTESAVNKAGRDLDVRRLTG